MNRERVVRLCKQAVDSGEPAIAMECDFYCSVLDLLKEQEQKRVLQDRTCETRPFYFVRKGYCPRCHQEILWTLNRAYCGFCGQAVKWE